MGKKFSENLFYGQLLKGDLKGAITYLGQFPEHSELHGKYISVFKKGNFLTFDTDDYLNQILVLYQKYYQEVFYLGVDVETAVENARNRFTDFFGIKNRSVTLGEIEQNEIARAFHSRSYQFLGGKTSGYFGPYIWKTTESKTYAVELPDGLREYTVRLLGGFLSKGWPDYISFGKLSPGGWADGDGIINCVKDSYDFEDESFTVSLLKHEAQHEADLSSYKNMSSEDLEYRAKLVELIYSEKRNLLVEFIHEADTSNPDNGHALAASRIAAEFAKKLDRDHSELGALSIPEIQSAAKELFRISNEEVKAKVCQRGLFLK